MAAATEVASTLTLPTHTEGVPDTAVRRVLQTYSFGFGVLLTVALLIVNIATEQGGFGLTQPARQTSRRWRSPRWRARPSIIGGGFDLSISPLIFFTNSVFVVWLAPHGLGGAISVPIMLGLGLAVGALTGLLDRGPARPAGRRSRSRCTSSSRASTF